MSVDPVRERTWRWLEQAVIGLDLCPFAEAEVRRGTVRLAVARLDDLEEAVRAVLSEAVALIETAPSDVSTTLVVFAEGLADFGDFLEVAALVDAALEEAGAANLLQTATFHPDYQFADVPEDDLGNYTNRAPYPVIQLLRVEDVGRAVDGHPDPEGIPDRNIARLEALGREAVLKLWSGWTPGSGELGGE